MTIFSGTRLTTCCDPLGCAHTVSLRPTEFLNSNELYDTDCLILDVRMPGMSGLDLQRQLRASNSRIPIVFITSHADDDARARALAAGAVAFLYKPCKKETLLEAIDSALNHKVP